MLEVLDPGLLATVQDLGRAGLAHLGVPPSGAADRPAHALANRLVGNAEGYATIEATLGGLRLRLVDGPTRYVASAGAPCPLVVAGRPAAHQAPVAVRPGDTVELRPPAIGLRTYLAVAGGVAVAPVLGSRSTDVFGGLGPAPLSAGDRLPCGAPGPPAAVDVAPAPAPGDEVAVWPGPRDDWLAAAGFDVLTAAAWTVRPESNRVAVRLQGPALPLAHDGQLPPEGLLTGAVQLPPSGRPVVFLADHPVTGGYPVVAVVDPSSLPAVAQARPGATLRFRTRTKPRLPSIGR